MQSAKTPVPIKILNSELGIEMEVRPEQPEKALDDICHIELGIEIDVRFEQPKKAPAPIIDTELGIIVFLHPIIKVLDLVSTTALQLSLQSNFSLFSSTIIEVKAEQPEKTLPPILVTDFPIVMEVSPVQP